VKRRVAVLARRAVTGRVKTRLSPALPAALACELHAALTADTLATVASAVTADERFILWDAPVSHGATAIEPGWTILAARWERPGTGGITDPCALVTVSDFPPLLAMMPATWVPWPFVSTPLAAVSAITRPWRSGWLASTPVSFTFTSTPAPVRFK